MAPLRLTALILALCILIPASATRAWDGQRRGFLLGLGMGPSYQLWSIHTRDQYWGFTYDFRIGWASDNTRLFYFTEGLTFNSATFLVNAAIGMNLYKSERSPSPYVLVEVGFYGGPPREGVEEDPPQSPPADDTSDEDLLTLGMTMGVGIEFSRHFSIELSLIAAPLNEFFPATVRLKVNVLGY
ncbi:MAG: hypothetical protein JW797_12550 [Bradymonadales bacterium]|nr:hypothetical protein [Bradymonadales bacterium]